MKKPEVWLSAVALMASLGGTGYSYKKLGSLQEDVSELQSNMDDVISEIEKNGNNNKIVKDLKDAMSELENLAQNHDNNIKQVMNMVNSQNHRIDMMQKQLQDILNMYDQDIGIDGDNMQTFNQSLNQSNQNIEMKMPLKNEQLNMQYQPQSHRQSDQHYASHNTQVHNDYRNPSYHQPPVAQSQPSTQATQSRSMDPRAQLERMRSLNQR